MDRLDDIKKKLKHLDKVVFIYEKGVNGFLGNDVTGIEWIYFNGNIENPERIGKVNGKLEVDYANNTVSTHPSENFSKYIINNNYVKNSYIKKNNISKYSIIESISSFKSLNDFKAIPLEVKCTANAILLLDLVGDDIFCSVKDFYPNPNGTITFEWYNKEDESILLEVSNSTFSYYVSFNSIEKKYFNKQVINKENSELLSTFINLCERNNILNTSEDKEIFIENILNPPIANDKLNSAKISHSEFIELNKIKIIK